MSNVKLFEQTKPFKLFLMVAIPGAISMVASSLWGIFDGIFVGNLVGMEAFAALNLAMPFVLINFSLADLKALGRRCLFPLPLVKIRRMKPTTISHAPV